MEDPNEIAEIAASLQFDVAAGRELSHSVFV
jgi:hypothetical protein